MRGRRYIQTIEGLNAYADELRKLNLPEHGILIELKFGKRTTKQNSAMHKYFTMLADELNNAGLDMKKVLKPSVSIPWTLDSVKTYLWGAIMQALTGKEHTSDLDRNEIDEVYMALSRHMAEKFGVMVEFPSKENQ